MQKSFQNGIYVKEIVSSYYIESFISGSNLNTVYNNVKLIRPLQGQFCDLDLKQL